MTDLTGIDLAALIERDGVTLRGQSERYGACPKCGGRDRFHVRSYQGREYFFCRQCHDRRGDAIEYLRWLHGMTYGEALRELGIEGDRPALPAARRPAPKTARGVVIPGALEDPPCAAWQGRARAFAEACAGALWAPGGARALDYLRGRGLSDDTIRRAGPLASRIAGGIRGTRAGLGEIADIVRAFAEQVAHPSRPLVVLNRG